LCIVGVEDAVSFTIWSSVHGEKVGSIRYRVIFDRDDHIEVRYVHQVPVIIPVDHQEIVRASLDRLRDVGQQFVSRCRRSVQEVSLNQLELSGIVPLTVVQVVTEAIARHQHEVESESSVEVDSLVG
jgi:hypothetical protein